jgi:hypothetical protein
MGLFEEIRVRRIVLVSVIAVSSDIGQPSSRAVSFPVANLVMSV